MGSTTSYQDTSRVVCSHLVPLHCVNELFDPAAAVGQTRHTHQPPWRGEGGGGGEESYGGR